MAHLSLEGTSGMEVDNLALLRMSQAIQGLDNIVQEFRDVENMSELGTAASAEDNSPETSQKSMCVVSKPTRIRLVAGTLKEKVETLVTDIMANEELQKLLPTLKKSTETPNDAAFMNELMISKQPTGSVDTTPALGGGTMTCMSGRDPKLVNRAAMGGQMGCRHLCEHHLELIDPWLWSKLPQELVEIVFAKLPVSKIIELIRDSEAWSTLSESSNFREFCLERHPKIFCLMRWDAGLIEFDTVRATVFDIKSNAWVSFDLVGFPPSGRCSGADVNHRYEDSMYASDGGLVCFVSPSDLALASVLVCNPLTSEWRTLPLIPHEHKRVILVQLVMDMDTKCYKVMLVCGHTRLVRAAHCYDSRTGLWSDMDSGFVYGGSKTLQQLQPEAPRVFDCRTNMMFDLKEYIPLSQQVFSWSSVKDRLVVLHEPTHTRPGRPSRSQPLKISEFAWRGSAHEWRFHSTESTVELGPYSKPPHLVSIFASDNFFLLIGDNSAKTRAKHRQLIQLYDRSAERWHTPSPMAADEVLYSYCLKRLSCVSFDGMPFPKHFITGSNSSI